MMKKRIASIVIIVLAIAVAAVSFYASYAWYKPDSPSGYSIELVADSVYSIYFSSTAVETEGNLIPAKAMPGAVAEGKFFDVTRLYEALAPEYNGNNDDICKSYVSETAETLSYATKFTNRGADTILVEYEWHIALSTDPSERLDKDEFVFDLDLWNPSLEEEIVPDENNRFYLSPVGDSNTIEIDMDVFIYFAKVDELMDPRLKDSELLVTVDLRRIWELSSGGYMEIRFVTDDPMVEGHFYPEEDPIVLTRDFIYSGASNYPADVSVEVFYYEIPIDLSLFIIDITFFNTITYQEILPDGNGKIPLPAAGSIRVDVEISFVYGEAYMLENHSELLNQRLYVTIGIGTAP